MSCIYGNAITNGVFLLIYGGFAYKIFKVILRNSANETFDLHRLINV